MYKENVLNIDYGDSSLRLHAPLLHVRSFQSPTTREEFHRRVKLVVVERPQVQVVETHEHEPPSFLSSIGSVIGNYLHLFSHVCIST